jgi:hypothetical protein
VNLAYSVGHYDIRISQPHPPGYPLFVAQMRILSWLRFKRTESILLVLAWAGSILALLLAVHCGNRIFGGDSGFWAALVLAFSLPFWHAGITSALRVQLAVISLAVAAACWKAWTGEGAWVRRSALVPAIGAGIRPETGVLLFPLWAVSSLRAPVKWAERGRSILWMAGTVMIWLIPAMIASGGPLTFIRANLDYISDQASVSSGLFGAGDGIWLRTFYRLLVWVFSAIVGVALPAVVAWRGRDMWGIGGSRLAFLGLWIAPAFAFALNVHVEDPGQTLIMVVVVALLAGYWIERAVDNATAYVSRFLVPILVIATWVVGRLWDFPNDVWRIEVLAVTALLTGLAMKLFRTKNQGFFTRPQAAALMIAPVLYTNYTYFNHHGWYYKGSSTSGIAAAAEHAWADINSGFALTSLEQIENTLAVDDHTLRETRRLAAEHPKDTVVVWERGLTAWRKVGYYAPGVKVFVLEHKEIRGGNLVIALWQGSKLLARQQGTAPLRLTLTPGTRIVWLLNPSTAFPAMVKQNFPVTAAGPVYYTDLPGEPGSRLLGEYEIAW